MTNTNDYLQSQTIEKIGRVAIEKRGNFVRLRFTYNGRQYSLTIGLFDKGIIKNAVKIAKLIDTDILWNSFDETMVKYGKPAKAVKEAITIENKRPAFLTINDIWINYYELKKESLSVNTKRSGITKIEKWLANIPTNKLYLSYANEQIIILKRLYAKVTIRSIWKIFKAACNLAIEQRLIEFNPYRSYESSFSDKNDIKPNSRVCKPFESWEVEIILEAFRTNRFAKNNSYYGYSYYYHYVLFLALTGCRPGEAIALTMNDVKYSRRQGNYLEFNKAIAVRKLKSTKTGKNRTFPINDELAECLKLAPFWNNTEDTKLIFPSVKRGNYINLDMFNHRYFKKVVDSLLELGEIENKLPIYHLRHTFITQMLQKGIDVATIAELVGNSTEMIFSHYAGYDKTITIPNYL